MKHSRKDMIGRDILRDIILRHVVPDLNQLNGAGKPVEAEMYNRTKFRFLPSDVAALVHLLIEGRQAELIRVCDDLLAQGCSAKELFLVLFTDCARKLGDMWCLDQCSFGDVTIGLVNLHTLMHGYRRRLEPEVPKSATPRTVLIASMPGDTHIFGPVMLEAFLSAAGWRCHLGIDETAESLAAQIATMDVDLVCLSVSCRTDIDLCRNLVRSVRARESKQDTRVMVGGTVFVNKPSLVGFVGADAMARSADEALDVAAGIIKHTREVYAKGVVS